jgi:hypothetical protein
MTELKRLSTIIIESEIPRMNKTDALYCAKELMENEWDNLSVEDQEGLERLIDLIKQRKE